MNIDHMANFLIGSILFAIGSIVLVFGVVLINNILHRYWEPITIVYWKNESVDPSFRFTRSDEKEPHMEQDTIDKIKK